MVVDGVLAWYGGGEGFEVVGKFCGLNADFGEGLRHEPCPGRYQPAAAGGAAPVDGEGHRRGD